MSNLHLTEISYKCGCHFAVYKKAVLVKLCKKHYEKVKDRGFKDIISIQVGAYPEDVWSEKKVEAWQK